MSGGRSGEAEAARLALERYLEPRRQLVDGGVAHFLARHYRGPVLEVVRYLATGGKRLRGILTILVCEALGGRAVDALAAAVAVEMAHAASLAHDDVLDGDLERRGRPALHVRYDVATAILVPHLVVPHTVLSAEIYGAGAMHAILEGWARVAQGQTRDYLPLHSDNGAETGSVAGDGADPEEEYRRIVEDKTGALFETAALLGALAAKNDRHRPLARLYGTALGHAFQIADDVTDLERCVEQPWDALLGDRIVGGARSLHKLRVMVGGAGEEIVTALVIGRARRMVDGSVARCAGRASGFPDSPVRPFLREFPRFAVDGIYDEMRAGR